MKAWSTAVFSDLRADDAGRIELLAAPRNIAGRAQARRRDRHDPDYMINGMRLNKLDKTGRLQYTLTAKQVVHFPTTTRPTSHVHLVYLQPEQADADMSSMTAHITSEGETVFMKDDVRIKA